MMSETDKPESGNDDFSGTRHAYAKSDETEMLHLLELVREGDKLHINDRARTVDVTDVRDTESDRVMTLVGNGSRYTVVVERNRDGEPTHAVLKLGSSQELISHVHVANRNAFMIPEYDRLMTEELETVAASHHVERLKEHVERTAADWNDFPEHHRTGEWTLSGDALAAVKWAISAFVAEYREDGQMGQSDYSLNLFTTSLALWEQVRGQRDAWTFVGSEMDKLGAYLDYGVEDAAISERIPDDAVDALDALRNGEDVGDIGLSHPEGGEDRDGDGDGDDGGEGADTEDSGRRGYVSPDAAERNSEALDHREQRNRSRTVQNSRSLGDSQLATDGGGTPRDVMVDCSPGDEPVGDGGDTDSHGDNGSYADDIQGFGPPGMSIFEASIRRNISGNWSLASDVWELNVECSDTHNLATFSHRDSVSRIQLSSRGHWVDTDVRLEVYTPLSKDEARQEPDDDINDVTVIDKTMDMMGEAVWLAEYYARNVDDRIPEDPVQNLYGPVEGGDSDE